MDGVGADVDPRYLQTIRMEGVRNQRSRQCVRPRQGPRLIDKFSELDFATANPPILFSGHYELRFIEQGFRFEILFGESFRQAANDEVDVALAQFAELRNSGKLVHLKGD